MELRSGGCSIGFSAVGRWSGEPMCGYAGPTPHVSGAGMKVAADDGVVGRLGGSSGGCGEEDKESAI